MNNLSDRLKCIADMVIPAEPMADIGTDHGYIPIALLAEGIVPFAVLSDINQGPLDIAGSNVRYCGFDSSMYSLRLGSGLDTLEKGEVSSVVIAGMGGQLIEQILEKDNEKSHSYKKFVLQPRTHANELRYHLSNNSFETIDYRLVKEKERICEVIAVKPVDYKVKSDTALISGFLLRHGDPLLKEFVDAKIKTADAVLENLSNSGSTEAEELSSVWRSILSELSSVRKQL